MAITVEPDPLQHPGTATIKYGGDQSGEVTIRIDDGGDKTDSVTIPATPPRETTWTVPAGWLMANFNGPGCIQVTRPIQTSAGAGG